MSKPDWQRLQLAEGVLREPGSDAGRLVLWVPGKAGGGFREWERIGTVPGAPVRAEQGLWVTAATSVPARQRLRGYLGRLLRRLRKPAEDSAWVLPDGGQAEQAGARQAGLLLVWADGPLEEDHIKARWPQATRCQRIGPNGFVVGGVAVEAPEATPPPGDPVKQAEQLLAEARQSGDRRRELDALTDLGIVTMSAGATGRAVALLEEALAGVRACADRSRQTDVLAHLGLAVMNTGQFDRGLTLLGEALATARAGGDRYGEKLALEHLGLAYGGLRDPGRAVAAYEQALRLACDLADQRHQAKLLWLLAIQHAERGARDQAVARAEESLGVFRQLGSPHVGLFADHLRRYRAGEPQARLAGADLAPPTAFYDGSVSATPAGTKPTPSGPGLLRMALSALQSMTRFVASGMRTVPADTHQERLRTCAGCAHHTGMRCRVCGCFTHVKAMMPHEKCPLGKWPALTTQQ